MTEALEAIADRFHPRERILVNALGSGNVNETFLVTHEALIRVGRTALS